MRELFAENLASVLSVDEWKRELLKDYLLGVIDYDMLIFEIKIQQMVKRVS
jgi:hypothetical protein